MFPVCFLVLILVYCLAKFSWCQAHREGVVREAFLRWRMRLRCVDDLAIEDHMSYSFDATESSWYRLINTYAHRQRVPMGVCVAAKRVIACRVR